MNNTLNPPTKEQFIAGQQFKFLGESGRYRMEQLDEKGTAALCSVEVGLTYSTYVCNVENITKAGCTIYGSHLGKSFRRKLLFKSCIAIPTPPVEAVKP